MGERLEALRETKAAGYMDTREFACPRLQSCRNPAGPARLETGVSPTDAGGGHLFGLSTWAHPLLLPRLGGMPEVRFGSKYSDPSANG